VWSPERSGFAGVSPPLPIELESDKCHTARHRGGNDALMENVFSSLTREDKRNNIPSISTVSRNAARRAFASGRQVPLRRTREVTSLRGSMLSMAVRHEFVSCRKALPYRRPVQHDPFRQKTVFGPVSCPKNAAICGQSDLQRNTSALASVC
jgi:hypothetical protein